MKGVLVAFHLFMVLMYVTLGGILLFTMVYSNLFSGAARLLMGILLIAYGLYRGYNVYRNVIRAPK